MKTVFITGTSSGIGRETAKLFQKKGWQVIASMRKPELENELNRLPNLKVVECDVTEPAGIDSALAEGLKAFGKIDVLVNNAGYYTVGVLEAATLPQIQKQLDTNLLGLIAVSKAFIPHFRQNRSGVIINLSSIAGLITVPLQTLYHATKWGVEGFSEALQYELRQFNIRVKIIEPGVIATDFFGRSMTMVSDDDLPEYKEYCRNVTGNIFANAKKASAPQIVAETVFRAATDGRKRMRYPTGYLKEMTLLSRLLPNRLFRALLRKTMEKPVPEHSAKIGCAA